MGDEHKPPETGTPAPSTPAPTPAPAGDGHGHGDPGHGDHGHGHHNPNQGHHWDTMDQQCHAGKFGMWLFLGTEVTLFAGLFCAYAVYRSLHPEVFAYASQFLDVRWGALNTIVLLISSFTVAMAVRSAQLGERQKTTMFLAITIACAAMFMGIKFIEYKAKFEHHAVWGLNYQPSGPQELEFDPAKHHASHPWAGAMGGHHGEAAGHGETKGGEHGEAGGGEAAKPADPFAIPPAEEQSPWGDNPLLKPNDNFKPPAQPPTGLAAGADDANVGHETPEAAKARVKNVHQFFGIYFIMTGTHGLHVVIGAIAILWVLLRNQRGDFTPEYNLPVDLVGLYWHLVDLIWIYLFPLLYLIDLPKWN